MLCLFCVQVLEEFYNIFGPELKAVTGDPKRIEDVLKRVDELVKPIEEVGIQFVLMTKHKIPVTQVHFSNWVATVDHQTIDIISGFFLVNTCNMCTVSKQHM